MRLRLSRSVVLVINRRGVMMLEFYNVGSGTWWQYWPSANLVEINEPNRSFFSRKEYFSNITVF
jgi:hypothetical protein